MNEEYGGVERRKFQRIKVSLTVIFRKTGPLDVRLKTADIETQATMLDMSEGGISILADVFIPAETLLFIKFTLTKTEQERTSFFGTVEVMGKVRYTKKIEDFYRMGISFEDLGETDDDQIRNFLGILDGRE